jgi:hypothetical protein
MKPTCKSSGQETWILAQSTYATYDYRGTGTITVWNGSTENYGRERRLCVH